MATLTQASAQWASRPDDERFVSLTDMLATMRIERNQSFNMVTSPKTHVSVAPGKSVHHEGLRVEIAGRTYAPTHHGFSQLAAIAAAPAAYLRTLPAEMAADCINYGLLTRDVGDQGFYFNEPRQILRAVTGPNYGRIYNADVVETLVDRFGDGVTGDWRVPGEFGRAVSVTKANTTLYASDRDMFVFLCDEQNRITVPHRRNNQSGSLARGFFIWNSEVGDKTLGFGRFLFDYVCSNRIVWGATQYVETRIRHTSSAPQQWLDMVEPQIRQLVHESTDRDEQTLMAARDKKLGDKDEVAEFLAKRFGKRTVDAIRNAHLADEGRPIETVWDAVTGATAYARSIPHQDKRVDFEREAGKLLELVAN